MDTGNGNSKGQGTRVRRQRRPEHTGSLWIREAYGRPLGSSTEILSNFTNTLEGKGGPYHTWVTSASPKQELWFLPVPVTMLNNLHDFEFNFSIVLRSRYYMTCFIDGFKMLSILLMITVLIVARPRLKAWSVWLQILPFLLRNMPRLAFRKGFRIDSLITRLCNILCLLIHCIKKGTYHFSDVPNDVTWIYLWGNNREAHFKEHSIKQLPWILQSCQSRER